MKYSFAPTLVLDKGLSATEALKESGHITDGRKMTLFLLYIACGLIVILSTLALGVGVFFGMAIASFAIVHAYRTFLGETKKKHKEEIEG